MKSFSNTTLSEMAQFQINPGQPSSLRSSPYHQGPFESLRENGGFTFSPTDGFYYAGREGLGGYAVGVARGDWVSLTLQPNHPHESLSLQVENALSKAWSLFLEEWSKGPISNPEIYDRLEECRPCLTSAEAHCFGAWLDGDRLVFDPSNIVRSRRDAVALGRHFEQDAIFNLGAAQEIRLSEVSP